MNQIEAFCVEAQRTAVSGLQELSKNMPVGAGDLYKIIDDTMTSLVGDDGMIVLQALSATVLVGLAPILILFLVPDRVTRNPGLIKILLGFALGGLSGDALLHLLPHALEAQAATHQHHSHRYSFAPGTLSWLNDVSQSHAVHMLHELAPWLFVLSGLLVFFLLDKLVRNRLSVSGHSCASERKQKKSTPKKPADAAKDLVKFVQRRLPGTPDKGNLEGKGGNKTTTNPNGKKPEDDASRMRSLAPSGFLNMIADFCHNFTDGLALGSTFRTGHGLQTTVAILFHEIPHEIGDFAVLMDSGFTKSEAMCAQAVTAVGAIAGCCTGLALGSTAGSNLWVTPFTAGGFLYIAIGNIVPSLLEDSSFKQTVFEVIGMVSGVTIMLYVAVFMEDHDH